MSETPPPSRDPEKAKRAARDPKRPGEKCDAAPGTWRPVVARARCEGKADCVAVCPYDVFEVGRIADEDYRGLVGGHPRPEPRDGARVPPLRPEDRARLVAVRDLAERSLRGGGRRCIGGRRRRQRSEGEAAADRPRDLRSCHGARR